MGAAAWALKLAALEELVSFPDLDTEVKAEVKPLNSAAKLQDFAWAQGATPLLLAVQAASRCSADQAAAKAVQLLLSHSANIEAQSAGEAALHGAARSGLREVVKVLLEGRADPMVRNAQGATPHALAQRAGRECAALLAEAEKPQESAAAEALLNEEEAEQAKLNRAREKRREKKSRQREKEKRASTPEKEPKVAKAAPEPELSGEGLQKRVAELKKEKARAAQKAKHLQRRVEEEGGKEASASSRLAELRQRSSELRKMLQEKKAITQKAEDSEKAARHQYQGLAKRKAQLQQEVAQQNEQLKAEAQTMQEQLEAMRRKRLDGSRTSFATARHKRLQAEKRRTELQLKLVAISRSLQPKGVPPLFTEKGVLDARCALLFRELYKQQQMHLAAVRELVAATSQQIQEREAELSEELDSLLGRGLPKLLESLRTEGIIKQYPTLPDDPERIARLRVNPLTGLGLNLIEETTPKKIQAQICPWQCSAALAGTGSSEDSAAAGRVDVARSRSAGLASGLLCYGHLTALQAGHFRKLSEQLRKEQQQCMQKAKEIQADLSPVQGRDGAVVRRVALRVLAPTDYYGLLGLPAYTSDRKAIKAAHRRTVKLVHPDILGPASGDLQVIVNSAYRMLSDDELREKYDTTLRRSKMSNMAMSQWANPKATEGLFVDETVCRSCLKCASSAPGTFEVDPNTRRAHVYLQGGNDVNDLDIAELGCPEQAITMLPRRWVPLLEYALQKSKSLQGRKNPFDLLAAAHCRVLQLTAKQDLGAAPPDAQLREEYAEMATALKEDFREARRNILAKYATCSDEAKKEAGELIAKGGRPPSGIQEDDELGVFVDETACSRCYKCVEVASSTFAVHRSPERGEKVHAVAQDADAAEILQAAVRNCPSRAISFVQKADVPLLDLAMREAVQLAQTSGVLKGPFQILEEYLVEDIIRMDLELKDFTPAQTRRDARSVAAAQDAAEEISEASQMIPEDVRQRLWRGIGGDQSAVKELEAMASGEVPSASRTSLKAELFQSFDADGDGFLYSTELRGLASAMGFEGSDSEWTQEYVMICTEVGCDPTQGLDFRGFSRMVDDEEAGYLEDEEMVDILQSR
ncbi:unnamed protein product [Effrenium voratum]|nr:unnamed protein product [Effrenium voratum]